MPTTMTLDGVRTGKLVSFLRNLNPRPHRSLGDASSDAAADFLTGMLGWGILAFAVGTAAIRGKRAVSQLLP